MLAFKVFNVTDTGLVHDQTIELDPASSKSISKTKELLELHKSKKSYVYPQQVEGVEFLLKPKPRGRTRLSDDIIVFIHKQFIEAGQSPIQLLYKVYQEFELRLTTQLLQSILAQEKYTEVEGIDELRKQALARMPKKREGRKKKITDEMKEEWYRMHEEQGMSGNKISKIYNVSSVSVNTALRERNGYRSKPEPVAILVSE